VVANNATLPATALALAGGQEGLSPAQVNVTLVNPRNLSLDSDPAHWPVRAWVDWHYNSSSATSPPLNLSAPSAVLTGPGQGFGFATQSYTYLQSGSHAVYVFIQTSSGLTAEKVVQVTVRGHTDADVTRHSPGSHTPWRWVQCKEPM
jgi:hypothetical protein